MNSETCYFNGMSRVGPQKQQNKFEREGEILYVYSLVRRTSWSAQNIISYSGLSKLRWRISRTGEPAVPEPRDLRLRPVVPIFWVGIVVRCLPAAHVSLLSVPIWYLCNPSCLWWRRLLNRQKTTTSYEIRNVETGLTKSKQLHFCVHSLMSKRKDYIYIFTPYTCVWYTHV